MASSPATVALAAFSALALTAAAPPPPDDPSYTLADAAAFTEPLGDVIQTGADRNRRMTVPVTIEGAGPFDFMVDTGSQTTVVSRALGERLKLPALGTATVVGMAGSRRVDLVRLDGLELASRMFDNLAVPVLEAQHMGADGILGLDSLQDLRVVLDFRAQTIAVDDAKSLGGDRGYEIVVRARNKKGRLIITNAEIDGVRTAVVIDTGSQGSIGNRALQRRLRARKMQDVAATDVTGATIVGQLGAARSLRIDGAHGRHMSLERLYVSYTDAPAFAALGLADKPAMVLGVEDLRTFERIAIDFAERTVLFDLPSSAQPASPIALGNQAKRL